MSSQKIKTYKQSEYEAIFRKVLAQGNYRDAARMAWPWYKQNDWSDKIWNALEKYDRLCIMGHASASKTFTASIWFLLDWLAYSDKTALVLTSTTMPSMNARIWADFKTLWTKSKIDFGGIAQIVDSKHLIRKSITEAKEAVHAVAADSDDSQSKIQGLHCERNRLIIDEADNPYSNSIWSTITNLSASGHFKFVALANPVDKNSEFGIHCEPEDGWDSINPEADFEWDSKRKCHVLRLDALQSPNYVAGYDKFPYLISTKAIEATRDNEGTNSPEWWSQRRAWFPPEGLIPTIFSQGIFDKTRNPIIWYTTKIPCASLDPAFEGGDECSLTLGSMGRLGHNPQRTALEANEFIRIKRKDMEKTLAFDYADQIVSILKDRGIEPKNFAIDTTGTQGPFADVIEEKMVGAKMGRGIMRVNFSDGASDRKVTSEDTIPASQMYKTFVTELWYVAREWCRLGLVYVKDPPRDLKIQLEARRYTLKGKDPISGRALIMAEPKVDMKSRGLSSPDKADSFSLLVHLVRTHALGFIPGSFKDKTPTFAKNFTKNATIWDVNYGVPDRPH